MGVWSNINRSCVSGPVINTQQRRIHKTTLYQKPMVLHLFIPPNSMHLSGVLYSHIYGNVLRIFCVNSNEEERVTDTIQSPRQLKLRGHHLDSPKTLFLKAIEKCKEAHCQEWWTSQSIERGERWSSEETPLPARWIPQSESQRPPDTTTFLWVSASPSYQDTTAQDGKQKQQCKDTNWCNDHCKSQVSKLRRPVLLQRQRKKKSSPPA